MAFQLLYNPQTAEDRKLQKRAELILERDAAIKDHVRAEPECQDIFANEKALRFPLSACFTRQATDDGRLHGTRVMILYADEVLGKMQGLAQRSDDLADAVLINIQDYLQENLSDAEILGINRTAEFPEDYQPPEATWKRSNNERVFNGPRALIKDYPDLLTEMAVSVLQGRPAAMAYNDGKDRPAMCFIVIGQRNFITHYSTSLYRGKRAENTADYGLAAYTDLQAILKHEAGHCLGKNEWSADGYAELQMAGNSEKLPLVREMADHMTHLRLQIALHAAELSRGLMLDRGNQTMRDIQNLEQDSQWRTWFSYGLGTTIMADQARAYVDSGGVTDDAQTQLDNLDRFSADYRKKQMPYELAMVFVNRTYLEHYPQLSHPVEEIIVSFGTGNDAASYKKLQRSLTAQNQALLRLIDDGKFDLDLEILIALRIIAANCAVANLDMPEQAVAYYHEVQDSAWKWGGFPDMSAKIEVASVAPQQKFPNHTP